MIEICRDEIVTQCISRIQRKTKYTNCYVAIAELEQACAKHQLVAYQNEEALIVLYKKEYYTELFFWCETWEWLGRLEEIRFLNEKLVISIIQKAGQELSGIFANYHLQTHRVYVRLRKSSLSVVAFDSVDVSYCDETDFGRLKNLMRSTFDPIGSNIPSDDELRYFLSNQEVICVRNEHALVKGFIIFEDKGKTSYIRMVCVDKACSGIGIGTQLMSMYFYIHSEFKGYTLWCAVDNSIALKLYGKFEYKQENIYNHIYAL